MARMELMNGDCLIEMDKIEDKSVDMILTDLPYGTTECKWDTIIPFDKLWEQYNRVIKDNGAIVLFGNEPFTSKLIMSNLKMFKYCWYWNKIQSSGFVHAKNMPLKNIEDVVVFSSGAVRHASAGVGNRMPYYPQGVEKLDKPKTETNGKRKGRRGVSFGVRPSHKPTYIQEFTNYPRQSITFSNCNTNKKGGYHPTQKPVELLEYLIKTYTNENEIVLDSTMGSGSTGVACVNTNRKFIGIELDEKYFEIAKKRISELNVVKDGGLS